MSNKGQIQVIKASGQREPFSEEKVRRSMVRAGISTDLQDRLMARIKSDLFDGITTRQIYDQILFFLEKEY
ncbi:ATP cone domain-containing protein, partial [Patescibacteria group bacterium]|nr:ATP cone domain-containing protein [Patescibacteria group bacterium]